MSFVVVSFVVVSFVGILLDNDGLSFWITPIIFLDNVIFLDNGIHSSKFLLNLYTFAGVLSIWITIIIFLDNRELIAPMMFGFFIPVISTN